MKACKNLIIVILAAGKGKRMLSHTPKVMHRILDRPMIHYVLKEAYKLNPEEVYVVTGFGNEELEKYLSENYPMAIPVLQKEQLGTGHAVSMVKKYHGADWKEIMILPGDSPLIKSKIVFPAASQGFSITPANGETHFELDVVAPQDLAALTFDSYATILLCNVGELPPAAISRLEQFVRLGGGLVIAPGERSLQSETGRRLLESTLVGATQLELVASAAAEARPHLFRPRQPDHPIIAPFRDRPEAGLSTTRIYNYVKLKLTTPEAWNTVVDYDTGDAALLIRQFGRGRIALLTTSLDDSWSSWPLWPSFVPMLRELERYISAGRAERAQLIVGDTWTLPALTSPDDAHGAEAAGLVDEPSTAALSITDPAKRTRTAELSNMDWTYSQTLQPGIYTVNSPKLNERFAVNIDPVEGATQRISIDTMQEGVLKNLSIHTQLAGDTSSLSAVPSSHEYELVFFLLLVGISLWLAELLLQRHVGGSSLLLLSLLEVGVLLGPEAGLLRLTTAMIMLMAGQGALLMLWQHRRLARTVG